MTGANAMQGEANLTFNGSQLDLDTGSGTFNRWKTDQLRFNCTGDAHIDHYTTGQKFLFRTSASSGADTNCLEIFSTGNVEVSSGNLVIGTAGKGIDFSATSDGTTMSSELLDDYEEGSFTATCDNSVTLSWNTLYYTRVGRLCHISGLISVNSDNSNATFTLNNLPFAGNNGFGLSAPFTRVSDWDLASDCKYVSGYTDSNKVYFQQVKDNASVAALPADSGANMIVNLTYYIN